MHYSKLLILSFCAVLFSCTALRQRNNDSQQSFKNILIAQGEKNGFYGPCEPTICINPTNTQNIAAGAILNRYYWSQDGGRTWRHNRLRSSHGVFGDPVITADTSGNFYYAHLSDPGGRGWASPKILDRIVIQKSTDGGKTYNDGTFTGNNHPKDQDKHWLVVNPQNNHIYCTWTEFDKYDSPKPEDHSRILFSKSTNAGDSWTEPVPINQFEGDCLDDDMTTEGAVPAAGPNGEIYVAWSWNDKVWFDRSFDGGQTWMEKDIVVANQPKGWNLNIPGILRCNGMPVLVCDLSGGPNHGTLYINWADQRNGPKDTDIWLSKSTDNGTTWSTPVRVNNDPAGSQQFFTWLAIDQTTGFLYLVFYDRRAHLDEQTDVYVAISKDGGKSFSNVKVSDQPFTPNGGIFFGDYNHISAHGGLVRPIWTRMEDDVLSIWTALMEF